MNEVDKIIAELEWFRSVLIKGGKIPEYYEAQSNILTKAIKLLEQSEQKKSIWTPVSKTIEIPEHEIIACDKYNEQIMGYLFCNDGQWICESEHEIMYDVVAWAEKLEPYKGETE